MSRKEAKEYVWYLVMKNIIGNYTEGIIYKTIYI